MIIKELERFDSKSYLSKIRSRNELISKERQNEVYEKCPEIEAVSRQIADFAINEIKRRLSGGISSDSNSSSDELKKGLDELTKQKKKLLTAHGFPENYLDPIYDCPICEDWGEVNGQVCSCIKKLRIQELYRRSNLSQLLEKENFDSFSLDYYSKESFAGKDISPYDNARRILDNARQFVADFKDSHNNLLIYGGTGLGKTFLSNCIAKALLDQGYAVLYLSSNELFDEVLSNYLLSKNDELKNTLSPLYEYIYNSDLLIIDDLGSELLSSFVKSQLFEIINKRIINGKSTIITTNLNLDSLQNNYTERVMSRIADKYTLYTLYGDDIRYLKKLQ